MKIEGKCALVTGGASGFGKELVRRLLSKGAKFVAILDYNEVAGKKVTDEFGEEFGADRIRFILCDVSEDEKLEAAFDEAFSVHGRLDIVVNNAGVWQSPKILQINLGSVILGTHLAKKHMDQNDGKNGGVVINTSSVLGFATIGNPEYTASKFGVLGFSLTIANCDPAFASGENIRMVVICPSTAADTSLFNGFPDVADGLAKVNTVSVNEVVDAYLLGIEDDTKHACCIQIIPEKGISLLPVKSAAEWAAEINMMKK